MLTRFLSFGSFHDEIALTIIDGDTYESKNRDRQVFDEIGNKARVSIEMLKRVPDFSRLILKAKEEYITDDSAEYLLEEGDIIFLCVDNHKTRNLVSRFCEDFGNVVLISGGNEYIDGNVQVFIRKEGKNLTLPLGNRYHPEIESPEDKSPYEMSCEELAHSVPQLVIMNNAIAATMLDVFYAYTQGRVNFDEVYVDILSNNCRAVRR